MNFPGLSFIDDEVSNVPASAVQYGNKTTSAAVEKKAFSSIENIEFGPKNRLPFKRDIDSPTKSLQLETCDSSSKLTIATAAESELRRSSLCILALKTAAAKATSTPFLKSSEQSSLSSMISLPGVPPVQGM